MRRRLSVEGQQEVWLVRHKISRQKFVIKVFETERYLQSASLHHSMTEAEAMYECRESPHVAQFVEEFEEGRNTHLVIKYEKGADLISLLETQGLTCLGEKQAKTIVKQVALGLHHIHSKGIVHRDLKHGNILIGSSGQAKIADFGLAVDLNDQKTVRHYAGTLSFMAPEIVENKKSD